MNISLSNVICNEAIEEQVHHEAAETPNMKLNRKLRGTNEKELAAPDDKTTMLKRLRQPKKKQKLGDMMKKNMTLKRHLPCHPILPRTLL